MTPQELIARYGPREAMEYDVVIVGAGPAGLSTAIRLKQLAAESGKDVSVVVLEKGSEPGAHILSGAVMDPRAITELLPNWKADGAPLLQAVTGDEVLFLSETGATNTPSWLIPDCMHNDGNYVISLGNVVQWLASQAEALGVEVFPGFAAAEVLYDDQGAVRGVATGNVGVGRNGEPHDGFQLGMELHGKYTIFAEGARGNLGRQVLAKYDLLAGRDAQSWAIGIKELWEIPADKAKPGHVVHTAGWPMVDDTFGGGFLYHLEGNKVTLGFVIGLDYKNPWMSPFEEMQRWKTHPSIRAHIEGGKRISYGARAINNGGLQCLPKLVFPGGALVGCDAGTMNASRIKGSHAAVKSGMLAAEAAFTALQAAHEELQAVVQEGQAHRQPDDRHRAVADAQAGHAHPAVDAAQLEEGQRDAVARRPGAEDRLPEAGQQAHLRPSQLGVRQQHQPRRRPADPPDAERQLRAGERQPGEVRGPRKPLLPGGRLRVRQERGQHRPAADQRAELRALQDLRHQGSHAEHRLGDARGRRRAELRRDVNCA
jgi:flavin-dependent dehydrogenase